MPTDASLFRFMTRARRIGRPVALALVAAMVLGGLSVRAARSEIIPESMYFQVAKVSGLLLNTRNDPAQPDLIGTGSPTLLAIAENIQTSDPNRLSTRMDSALPTTVQNGTVVGGVNTVAIKFWPSAFPPAAGVQGLYRVSFFFGGTRFPSLTVLSANADESRFGVIGFATGDPCKMTSPPVRVEGGAVGQSIVTYQFALDPACSANNEQPKTVLFLVLDTPWRQTALDRTTIIVTAYQDKNGTGTYNPLMVVVRDVVKPLPAVQIDLGSRPKPAPPATVGFKRPTRLAFGTPPYTSISTAAETDTIIGSAKFSFASLLPQPNASPYAGALGTGDQPALFTSLGYGGFSTVKPTDISAEVVVTSQSGSWNNFRPAMAGFSTTVISPRVIKLTTSAPQTEAVNINLTQITTPNQPQKSVFAPQAYQASLTAKFNPALGLSDISLSPVPLETVYPEGATFRAPWFGGNLAANSGQLRIVNDGAAATGPLYIALRAPSPATVNADQGCVVANSLAPGSEYLFGVAEAANCFGSFRRADLLVALSANPSDLIAKARITSAGNYAAETALEPAGLDRALANLTWFGGSRASTPSVTRISNISDVTSGPVSLTLTNIVDGERTGTQVCDQAQLPSLATVPAQGELVISSPEATACFGNFRRGDLSINIAGSSEGLTTRMRVISGAGKAVAEQTLGTLPADQLNNARFGNPVELMAGWFGGPKAATPSVLRLGNTASDWTGSIRLTLNNITDGAAVGPLTCDATKLATLQGVPPGGELVIDSTNAKTCFGDFRRGNLTIWVSGPASGLTAKMRVISSSQAIVTEQLLGPRCIDMTPDGSATCIQAPWFEGPKSVNQSVLRLNNVATTATGAVQIKLKNTVEGSQSAPQLCGPDKLPTLAAIPAQGELVFDIAAAKTCFGDFRRGDLEVTIAGSTYGIYPLMRLISANGAMVSDQSLGKSAPGIATNH